MYIHDTVYTIIGIILVKVVNKLLETLFPRLLLLVDSVGHADQNDGSDF